MHAENPKCDQCPVAAWCQTDEPETLPVKPEKKARRVERKHVYVWTDGKGFHMNRRPKTGLLANLYEFDETMPDEVVRTEPLAPYTHIFSHVEWQMDATLVFVKEDAGFYSVDQIENELALPSAFAPFFEEAREKIDEDVENEKE